MSNLMINDLSFLTELDVREADVAGGASAGSAAGADKFTALAIGVADTDDGVEVSAEVDFLGPVLKGKTVKHSRSHRSPRLR